MKNIPKHALKDHLKKGIVGHQRWGEALKLILHLAKFGPGVVGGDGGDGVVGGDGGGGGGGGDGGDGGDGGYCEKCLELYVRVIIGRIKRKIKKFKIK